MRKVLVLLATLGVLGSASLAQAAPIVIDLTADPDTLSPGDVFLVGTTNTNSNLDAAGIFAAFGVDVTSLLYKSNVDGGSEEGGFANNYTTTYSNTSTDPANALIEWDGPTWIASCPTCYLLVKDGNSSPAQYLFNLGAWDGKDSIALTGFWPQQGAISNVSIWNGATSVPEPSSILLVLLGLAGIGATSRKGRRSRL